MKRTMVYLPDNLHKGLKHLAVELGTSLAQLIREAADVMYHEDLQDLAESRKRLHDYLALPEKAIPYSEYRARRLKGH